MSAKLMIAGAAVIALSATPAFAAKNTPTMPSGPIPYSDLQAADAQMNTANTGGEHHAKTHHHHHAKGAAKASKEAAPASTPAPSPK